MSLRLADIDLDEHIDSLLARAHRRALTDLRKALDAIDASQPPAWWRAPQEPSR